MTTKFIIFNLFLLVGSSNCVLAENKIVYLISPPRSLSTAFLRMIEGRGDFIIINEPSVRIMEKNNTNKYYKNTLTSFDQVKEKILHESKTSNVFVKEISRSVKDFLLQDQNLVKKENIYFIFLVRNPHHSIISFYKKILHIFPNFSDIIGYESTYEILKYVQKNSPNKPLIILSEDLYNNPSQTIEEFCQSCDLDWNQNALHWTNLGDDFTGQNEWNETKQKAQTYHWHGDAIKSSGFITPHMYATDKNGIATFEEIMNIEDRKQCKKIYYENLKYYDLILKEIDQK